MYVWVCAYICTCTYIYIHVYVCINMNIYARLSLSFSHSRLEILRARMQRSLPGGDTHWCLLHFIRDNIFRSWHLIRDVSFKTGCRGLTGKPVNYISFVTTYFIHDISFVTTYFIHDISFVTTYFIHDISFVQFIQNRQPGGDGHICLLHFICDNTFSSWHLIRDSPFQTGCRGLTGIPIYHVSSMTTYFIRDISFVTVHSKQVSMGLWAHISITFHSWQYISFVTSHFIGDISFVTAHSRQASVGLWAYMSITFYSWQHISFVTTYFIRDNTFNSWQHISFVTSRVIWMTWHFIR